MTKAGNGSLSLQGSGITYIGNTTVAGGTLQLYNAFGAIQGPAGNLSVASGAVLEFYTDNGMSLPYFAAVQTLTGAGVFRKTGPGEAQLGNGLTVNLSGGTIDVEQGTLMAGQYGGADFTNNKASLNVASGATFDLWDDYHDGNTENFDALTGGGVVTNNAGYTADKETLCIGVNNGSGTFNGSIALGRTTGDGTSTVNLIKRGTGIEVLAGNNTYAGSTTISGGTLQIGNGGSGEYLASPTINNNSALAFNNADTLAYAGAISGSGQVSVSGGGTLILSGNNAYSGATTVNASTLQIGNGGSGEGLLSSIAMSNNATVVFNHADPLTYSGTISGSGQLIKLGTGNLDLVGAATYSGPTTISAGTLELDVNGENLPPATALTIASGGVLDMAGVPQTVGSLSGSAGAIITSRYSGNPTLTVAMSSGSTTFAGNIISNNALALSGSGQLTLSGTNAYTGGTTVSGGTLDIAAPSALAGSGLVTIAAGGRLVLGSGAGIGALLAASTPVGSGAVALSAAASAPATIGGYESTSRNMATLGDTPASSQGSARKRRRRRRRGRAGAGNHSPACCRGDRLRGGRRATEAGVMLMRRPGSASHALVRKRRRGQVPNLGGCAGQASFAPRRSTYKS